jgi:predicted nucleic acid-binding protein
MTMWKRATDLGQSCRHKNFTPGSINLLIAAIALHHHAEIVTFDADFQKIADASSLQVKLLQRPTP